MRRESRRSGSAACRANRADGVESLQIRDDDLTGEAIIRLLGEHLAHMHAVTPAESIHALDLRALRVPEISFWTAWEGDELLGCGALKQLDRATGEIKSMRTVEVHRGRGVASRLLEHILEVSRGRGYERLLLETGAMDAFRPARMLYARFGFVERGPFGEYVEDPNSVFMEKDLAASLGSSS